MRSCSSMCKALTLHWKHRLGPGTQGREADNRADRHEGRKHQQPTVDETLSEKQGRRANTNTQAEGNQNSEWCPLGPHQPLPGKFYFRPTSEKITQKQGIPNLNNWKDTTQCKWRTNALMKQFMCFKYGGRAVGKLILHAKRKTKIQTLHTSIIRISHLSSWIL